MAELVYYDGTTWDDPTARGSRYVTNQYHGEASDRIRVFERMVYIEGGDRKVYYIQTGDECLKSSGFSQSP